MVYKNLYASSSDNPMNREYRQLFSTRLKARRKKHLFILNSEDSENYFRSKLYQYLPEQCVKTLKRLVLSVSEKNASLPMKEIFSITLIPWHILEYTT